MTSRDRLPEGSKFDPPVTKNRITGRQNRLPEESHLRGLKSTSRFKNRLQEIQNDALGSRFLVLVVDYFVHLGVDFKLWEYYFQQKGVDVGYLEADSEPLGIKLWLWKLILDLWDLTL